MNLQQKFLKCCVVTSEFPLSLPVPFFPLPSLSSLPSLLPPLPLSPGVWLAAVFRVAVVHLVCLQRHPLAQGQSRTPL